MAARQHSLSSSIAGWHGDEQPVGSPLTGAELRPLRRTRLFGSTGTILMAIGALGAGPARRSGPDVRCARAQPAVAHPDGVVDDDHHRRGDDGAGVAHARAVRPGHKGGRRLSRGQLDRTLLLWMLPC